MPDGVSYGNKVNPIQTGLFSSICDWGGGGPPRTPAPLEPIMLGS